jgi:flavin-dependent dehydrogenase
MSGTRQNHYYFPVRHSQCNEAGFHILGLVVGLNVIVPAHQQIVDLPGVVEFRRCRNAILKKKIGIAVRKRFRAPQDKSHAAVRNQLDVGICPAPRRSVDQYTGPDDRQQTNRCRGKQKLDCTSHHVIPRPSRGFPYFAPGRTGAQGRGIRVRMAEMETRTIAIIGGGPAGATTAEKLAQGWGLRGAGNGEHRVLVFEEKLGWEKPCGGGLSHKALRRYPFLAQVTGGGNFLHVAEFLAPSGTAMRFHLRTPLAVYSRATLNHLLLRRAQDAGAEVVADRIVRLRRREAGWEIAGRREAYRADFIVLAAGARTRLRQTLTDDFPARDFMLTLGYYLPAACEVLRVQFYENFEGYAWAFPRMDHVSVGICGKAGDEPMAALRDRLSVFMEKFGYAPDPQRIFSHLLPSLSVESWDGLRLAGQGWALVGDAAGLVDPITGEGIYYALRSGDLLAQALLEGLPEVYLERVRNEFGRTLAMGARLSRMFYHGEFLGGGVTTRMIEFGTHSRKILEVMQDLIEGSQSYSGLLARLFVNSAGALVETGVNHLRLRLPLGAEEK